MSAALPEASAFAREADQRNEQHLRLYERCVGKGLRLPVGPLFQIAIVEGIDEACKSHGFAATGEARQGQFVTLFEEMARIGCGGRFVGIGVVKADRRTLGYQRAKRGGRSHEDQRPHRCRERGDMVAARDAQILAKIVLGHAAFLLGESGGTTMGRFRRNPLTPKTSGGYRMPRSHGRTGGPGQGQLPWIAYSLRDIHAARAGQPRHYAI